MTAHDAATTVHLLLPLEVTVRVGALRGDAPAAPATEAARPDAHEKTSALEGRVDRDYSDRKGYDETFTGVRVALPTLTAKGMRRVARRVDVDPFEGDHVVPYHHYSAVMNRVRRFCFFTAANTTRDPRLLGTKSREELGGAWTFDPRIAREHQVGHEEFYRPAIFDKGHIHRREDGDWGATGALREAANADTFHFTNATPQHPKFNQSKWHGEWGLLENHIADQVGSQRYSIFAGPIFKSDDPVIEGVLVPRSFWKIVVARRRTGIGAWAFVLDQSHLPFESAREGFDPGGFVNHQRSVDAIERLTDVRFDAVVRDGDALRETPEERVAIESLSSIRGLR